MTKAQDALAELKRISTQVQAAVLVDGRGAVAASTLPDERAARLASGARELLESAEEREAELTQLEAATAEGSLFVVRDAKRVIAATTGPEPTAGLVFYDLRHCLRQAAQRAKPKRAKTSGSS